MEMNMPSSRDDSRRFVSPLPHILRYGLQIFRRLRRLTY